MEIVTILWSFCAAVAITLAVAYGVVWLTERRDLSGLMLCLMGLATAGAAYAELHMLHSATAAEYGEWLRWYYFPTGLALVSMLLFVHYYLGTGRVWLLWTAVSARLIVLLVNGWVHPNFGFSEIVSLRSMSLFGEPVSVIGVAIPSERQWFAVVASILLTAYIIDAAIQGWLKGRGESRRKAFAVSLGIAAPMLGNIVYGQLMVIGVLHVPLSNMPWFLGALLTMAYELGRDIVLSRHAQQELWELRNRMAQGERASLLGQLASTLAHELSQPLSSNLANLESARIHLSRARPDLEQVKEILADISRDDCRAAEIIDRMRQFLKRGAIEMRPLSVDDLVQDAVSLVRPEANARHVALHLRLEPGLPQVSGDRVHLTQVLVNLVTNSIHAVQSRPPDCRTVVVEARTDAETGGVEMAVCDSGPGIPDAIADEVFASFFTTRSDGMGVGLSLSRAIIDAHGGHMWIDRTSELGGAVFRFTLRRA